MFKPDNLPDPDRAKRLFFVLSAICFIAVISLIAYGPIPQDQAYHKFADQRTLLGVYNFWNVFSNIPFLIIGILGLRLCATDPTNPCLADNLPAWRLFFAGILLTGLSSAFYHYQPNNLSLLWDRLSMALCFMALLDIVISSFISRNLGQTMLAPLVIFGILSLVYWIATEHYGAGDLRLYAVVQFLPFLIIPLIVLNACSTHIQKYDIVIIGLGYAIAKLFEFADTQVYLLTPLSGHSLKHLAAAFSAYWVLKIVQRGRTKTAPPSGKQIIRRENHEQNNCRNT